MATIAHDREPKVAKVDALVDEHGSTIEVPPDSALEIATDAERTVGATGPTNWWRLGLIAVVIVAAILLVLQLMNGNTGTDMIPGTPTAAPQGATQQ